MTSTGTISVLGSDPCGGSQRSIWCSLAYRLAPSVGDAKFVEERHERSSRKAARQPTSNGKQCTCHCFSAHLVIREAYLVFLRSFASCMCSSHGTVSSPMMRTLAASYHMTRSGRRRAMAAATGKTSLPDRSDSTFQSHPPCRILTLFCGLPAFWSVQPPSDMKWMCLSCFSLLILGLQLLWPSPLPLLWQEEPGHASKCTFPVPELWGRRWECAAVYHALHTCHTSWSWRASIGWDSKG